MGAMTTSHHVAVPAVQPAEPDVATPIKNLDWHAAVEDLVASGKTVDEARSMVIRLLALQAVQTLLQNARAHLSVGNDTNAAMFTIAVTSVRDLPAKLEAAGTDQEKAREAIASARAGLKSGGSLFDMIHPSGRHPIFQGTDEVLSDFEEFLSGSSAS
jgi:hypothetical protein